MDYNEYLKTERWQTLSELAKSFANEKCQLCNSHNKIQTHHRTYENLWTKMEFFDLIVLCCDCHEKYHDELSENKYQQQWVPQGPGFEKAVKDWELRKALEKLHRSEDAR